ncbi:MAG TPA: DNA-binding protein [Nannocystis exedens]|nr:DNA-binding protein [Nannocystis exedens]
MALTYRSRGLQFLEELIEHASEALEHDAGMPHDGACAAAHAIADRLRKAWGGEVVYIPKGLSIDLSERDRQFYREWNGTPDHLRILCSRYGLSLQSGYAIIRAVRRLLADERAQDIGPLEPASREN